MMMAMAIASGLCIFIGCYTPYLYKMLPYPVDYQPYTPYHISETVQILLFTGVGFFLLLSKLKPEAKISLDLDWFYRVGGRAFLWLARKPIQSIDTLVGQLYQITGLVPLTKTARRAGRFDNEVIDGFVDGVAQLIRGAGRRLRSAQRGRMQESLAFAFGVAAVLIVVLVLYSYR
jgi:multicomponent Na+:H+ antiporter subunit D